MDELTYLLASRARALLLEENGTELGWMAIEHDFVPFSQAYLRAICELLKPKHPVLCECLEDALAQEKALLYAD